MERILVVDDDPGFCKLLATILSEAGYAVETAAFVVEALRAGERAHFNLVLTDLRLPDGEGLDILRKWHEREDTPFVVITAFGTISSAVEAMKAGAQDYLTKPLDSPEQLRVVIRKALGQAQVTRERDLLREQEAERFSCGKLVAKDTRMRISRLPVPAAS